MKISLRTSTVLLGLATLASCTSHLRRNPSSVSSCNIHIDNLEHVVDLSDSEKSDFMSAAQKHNWNMVFNKSELREGDYVVSGLIENHLQKKLSFRNNYVYFVPYNLKVDNTHAPEVASHVSEVAFDHKYEIKALELSSYGLRGRSVASQSFKKSYKTDDSNSPFHAQFEDKYFSLGDMKGGSLTHSKWASRKSMNHFFKDVVGTLPSCSDI